MKGRMTKEKLKKGWLHKTTINRYFNQNAISRIQKIHVLRDVQKQRTRPGDHLVSAKLTLFHNEIGDFTCVFNEII